MSGEPKTALVLSGGGARGLAHIGVIKVLEEAGLRVDLLAGTSMGGVIAAGYAAGMDAAAMESEALKLTRAQRLFALADPLPPRGGLLRGDRVVEFLTTLLGPITFRELRLPLAVVAVDLLSGQEVALAEGPVVEALRATIAVPGLFAPVERDGRLLVDGGVLNNLPVTVARRMGADRVVAVSVVAPRLQAHQPAPTAATPRPLPRRAGLRSTIEIVWMSLELALAEMERRQLAEAPVDLLIRPVVPPELNPLNSFVHGQEIIACGEAAARAVLPRLRELAGTGPT